MLVVESGTALSVGSPRCPRTRHMRNFDKIPDISAVKGLSLTSASSSLDASVFHLDDAWTGIGESIQT